MQQQITQNCIKFIKEKNLKHKSKGNNSVNPSTDLLKLLEVFTGFIYLNLE